MYKLILSLYDRSVTRNLRIHFRLAQLVEPPEFVRDLSWISTLWPTVVPDGLQIEKPLVQRYCLMGVKDSFTDFHIDFGGTSVWYHVLKVSNIYAPL